MPFLQISGSNLEYFWHGPDSNKAPTMVFLHGGLGCAAAWGDYPARLADAAECGALVYSRAGYGSSSHASLPRPISFMHEEALHTLPQILEFFRVRKAILVGHSDGGSIALIHAGGKAKFTPILAIVLEAPHVFVEDITVSSISAAVEHYDHGSLKTALDRHHADPDHTFFGWSEVWLNPRFRSWNIEDYLPGIKRPVLVLQGDQDQFGTLRQMEAISEGCGGYVQTHILPECGHRPHRRCPDQVARITVDFLRSCVYPRRSSLSLRRRGRRGRK